MSVNLLEVKNMVTTFDTEQGRAKAVDGVSFNVKKGSVLGIVGESGCGKSVTCLSIMRLLPKPSGQTPHGEILFDGKDLLKITAQQMRRIRGNKVSMIFQEPMTALNPVYAIGRQLLESYNLHRPDMSASQKTKSAVKLLSDVGIPDPQKRMKEYPHQLSGGMRQRVMIAIALACRPKLLIADEPTTALDVTIQAQILKLMRDLQKLNDMTIIFITHDLAVVAEMCKDVIVMYAGQVVESAPIKEIFKNPRHPYTKGLLFSMPTLTTPRNKMLNEIDGMVPDLFEIPPGCRFQNRCPYVQGRCRQEEIPLKEIAKDHNARCLRINEV
ncbi:ABC transporter ATP-binding protein [Elusimicrobiota bacterium]